MTKRNIDYDAVERDYRAGVLTMREIGALHGLSDAAVVQRAKKYGWTRNLDAKIKAKAKEKLSKEILSEKLNKSHSAKFKEALIIESEAAEQAKVLRIERSDIKRLSERAKAFELELESETTMLETRTRILKALTEIREKIINLRRRNYGINDNANGEADAPTITIIDNFN